MQEHTYRNYFMTHMQMSNYQICYAQIIGRIVFNLLDEYLVMYVLLMIRNNLFTTTLNKQLTYAQSLYIYILERRLRLNAVRTKSKK